ncbi:hypothetical protein [Thermoanaerobacterium sp. RBIITD]|uniref:ABC transporter ATP-binding protein n=1 Tax=Thermoanaerobacterium sp. RBIITD TaxID=1550240 RepID=UPI0012FD7D6B
MGGIAKYVNNFRSESKEPFYILLQSVLLPDPWQRTGPKPVVRGEPTDPANSPSGCRFHPRCPYACDV